MEEQQKDYTTHIRLRTPEEQLVTAEKVINELLQKLESQREEAEKHLTEGFEQAYQCCLAEQKKTQEVEQRLYDEYEDRLKGRVKYLTEMVDKFLKHKWEEFSKKGEDEARERMGDFRKTYSAEQIVGMAMDFRPRLLSVTEMVMTFEMLERAMNLPHDVKIVAVQETDQFKVMKIRFVSDREMPDSYSMSELSKVGDMFLNPEKYKVDTKGSTRGA